jgi:hypothetical protein
MSSANDDVCSDGTTLDDEQVGGQYVEVRCLRGRERHRVDITQPKAGVLNVGSPNVRQLKVALPRPGQAPAGRIVADALSEVSDVLLPDVRRDRVDGNEVQVLDLGGVRTVDACVAGPERHLARWRVEQSTVLVVGLTRERGCDLLHVDSGHVEHLLGLEPESSVLERVSGPGRAPARSRGDMTCPSDPGDVGGEEVHAVAV